MKQFYQFLYSKIRNCWYWWQKKARIPFLCACRERDNRVPSSVFAAELWSFHFHGFNCGYHGSEPVSFRATRLSTHGTRPLGHAGLSAPPFSPTSLHYWEHCGRLWRSHQVYKCVRPPLRSSLLTILACLTPRHNLLLPLNQLRNQRWEWPWKGMPWLWIVSFGSVSF